MSVPEPLCAEVAPDRDSSERLLERVRSAQSALEEVSREFEEVKREAERHELLHKYAQSVSNSHDFQERAAEVERMLETGEFGDDLITPDEYRKEYLNE